jgi:hypothetical protein
MSSSTSSSSSSTDLNTLSWKTILEYNQPTAFAVSTDNIADTTLTKYDDVTTKSYKASTGLLSNLSDELDKLKTNLQLIQNYTLAGDKAVTDKKKETAYAQIRSLSAGIDSIVRSYKLEGTTLLTGRDYELSYGSSGTPLKMTLDNLASSFATADEKKDNIGLKLATADEGATATISYDYLNKLRNASTSISGLDISEAYAVTGDATHEQLTDGDYQVEVKYLGANSTVYIEKLDGTVIDSQTADLSGSGQMELKFDCGVGLSIEKDSWALSEDDVDKYDYETYGAVSLYANLKYDTVQEHNLDDGTGETAVAESSVSVTSGSKLTGTTGSVKVAATTTSVADGRTAMTTGKYTANVQYNGAQSSVWLYDENGKLISTVRDVDLTKDKATTVDMGTGVSITVDPTSDFTSTKRTYTTTLDYTAQQDAYEVFDFDAYYDVVTKALKTLEENQTTVSDAEDELKSRYSIVQSAQKLAGSSGASATSSLMSVLASGSSGVSATSLFSTLQSSNSSSSTTTTPTVLSATSSNIISCLSSTVSSLSGVDNDILALYYK